MVVIVVIPAQRVTDSTVVPGEGPAAACHLARQLEGTILRGCDEGLTALAVAGEFVVLIEFPV